MLCRGPTRTLLVADLPLRRKDPSLRLSVPLPAPLSRALPPACLPLLQLPDCHGHRLPRGPGRRPRHSPECERALALAGGAALPHTGAADISLQLCSLFRRGDWQWGALLVSNAAMHARLASSGLTACPPGLARPPATPQVRNGSNVTMMASKSQSGRWKAMDAGMDMSDDQQDISRGRDMVDSLFQGGQGMGGTHNSILSSADYLSNAGRTLGNIEEGYYIAPAFLDKLSIHVAKNFLDLPKIKVPLILGIWGGKGQGEWAGRAGLAGPGWGLACVGS